nr:hypothetical protein [uncultured Mucilaginibacter sp.]
MKCTVKLGIIAILSLHFTSGYGQKPGADIKQLRRLFKESIDQPSKGVISVGNSEWTICNQDSSYFKSDTVRIYSNINYFYQISNCCNFVNWTFYNKNAFVLSKSQICKEPSSASVKVDYYRFNIFLNKKKTYLSISNTIGAVEKFEVIDIREIALAQNNSTQEITLKRNKAQ